MTRTVAIVGASRGIGLELARQYAADNWRVHATVRSDDAFEALRRLEGDIVGHSLDVTKADEIRSFRRRLKDEALDHCIHSAGINGGEFSREEIMRVNAQAPFDVVASLLDRIIDSDDSKLALLSSQRGARRGSNESLGDYGDSKAALNDRFRELCPDWAEQGLVAVLLHPGWVRTDMGGTNAPLSVRTSAKGIRSVMANLTAADHGRFLTWEGEEHPW